MKNNDAQLIQRVLEGDDAAFSALVKKYQKPVHALVWRKIGDFHIAEDIAQDTFLKAYQKLSTLKKPQRFASWLYVIATNYCKMWIRKKRLSTQSLEDINSTALEGATYSGYVIAENEQETAEAEREVVKKLLAKLQESERTVITLHYLGGMTYKEISEFLGVSVGTIKTRVYRARQRLKKEEPMIREALENFQIAPSLTDNIMQEISRLKPVTPSGSKPLVPWAVGVSTLAVVFLMLGVGTQYLSRFQKPYSFSAASEMKIELIDAPVVLNLESKPDIRTQLGNVNTPGKSNAANQQRNDVSASVADAPPEETVKDYSQWQLPKAAKARFGKGGINAIQFSPDGTQLAVGSNIGIWLYDVETGEEKSLFAGMCQSLAFSPDGRFLANGGGDFHSDGSKVQLWEIASGREILFPDVYDTASALRFSSDGKTLVSVGSGGQFIIRLNIETKEMTSKFFKRGEPSDMSDETGVCAVTDDKVAIGRTDGKIALWDIATYKALSTLKGHIDLSVQPPDKPFPPRAFKNKVLAVVFSPDGTRLASGSTDKTVRLWDLTDEDKWMTLEKHTGWTNVLAFSPNGKMLASGSTDKTVQLWNTTTGERLATFTGHINGITTLAFSPDGTTLVSGSADGMVRFWNTQTAAPLADSITGHAQSMQAATFFEDNSTLASVAFNGEIAFWDTKTSQKSTVHMAGHRDWLSTLAFSPDGTKLVSVGVEGATVFGAGLSTWQPADHLIRLTDVRTGGELAILQYRMGAKELTFSPDGETVAFTGLGEIRLWNTRTGDEQAIPLADLSAGILHNVPGILALAFSPHGTWLVSGSDKGKIQMWDVVTGGALTVFAEPTEQEDLGRILALAFSPDGTLLAAGIRGHIHLWEVDTANKLLSVDPEHRRGDKPFGGAAEPLVFSPDGSVLVNGLHMGSIQLWDVTTGDKIAALDGHTQKVETLAFSPDGTTLVSTAADGTILLWDWNEMLKGSAKSE
ncbi:MAG: sigma-70 family RNA polymerase sigma factor [Candidatus Poribacteria bacterium]|nr:sigma-70 family RNA polymerase sigma factor [Candidatus Poribacteria bacterium]